MRTCSAKTASGQPCRKIAMEGKKYCNKHKNHDAKKCAQRIHQALSRSVFLLVLGGFVYLIGAIADITGILDYLGIEPRLTESGSTTIRFITENEEPSAPYYPNTPVVLSEVSNPTITTAPLPHGDAGSALDAGSKQNPMPILIGIKYNGFLDFSLNDSEDCYFFQLPNQPVSLIIENIRGGTIKVSIRFYYPGSDLIQISGSDYAYRYLPREIRYDSFVNPGENTSLEVDLPEETPFCFNALPEYHSEEVTIAYLFTVIQK